LYLQIYAPNNGPKIFDSSPDVNNTPLPYTFPVGIKLGSGNYTLKVVDEDSGLKGSDDDCGTTSFNQLSNGSIVAGGLTVFFNILHPVEEIISTDTVTVYPQPVEPSVSTPNGNSICAGETGLVLTSSYGSGNQWLLNGSNLPGATDFIYVPTQSGYYQTQIITQYGCVATSDSAKIDFFALPAPPVWYNYNNSLRLFDTAALPALYSLQWYAGSNPIPGETGIWYCSMTSGTFGLQVTDLATGCTNTYANLVENNPLIDCSVGTEDIGSQYLAIMPNPASETALIRLNGHSSVGTLRLWDVAGRLIYTEKISAGQELIRMDLRNMNNGLFAVEVLLDGSRSVGKLAVSH
jgi:hypothetical protein